jgi:hypothetical protein
MARKRNRKSSIRRRAKRAAIRTTRKVRRTRARRASPSSTTFGASPVKRRRRRSFGRAASRATARVRRRARSFPGSKFIPSGALQTTAGAVAGYVGTSMLTPRWASRVQALSTPNGQLIAQAITALGLGFIAGKVAPKWRTPIIVGGLLNPALTLASRFMPRAGGGGVSLPPPPGVAGMLPGDLSGMLPGDLGDMSYDESYSYL